MSTAAAAGRAARIATAHEALERLGAEWLLAEPSADFRWLTGAVARSTETSRFSSASSSDIILTPLQRSHSGGSICRNNHGL